MAVLSAQRLGLRQTMPGAVLPPLPVGSGNEAVVLPTLGLRELLEEDVAQGVLPVSPTAPEKPNQSATPEPLLARAHRLRAEAVPAALWGPALAEPPAEPDSGPATPTVARGRPRSNTGSRRAAAPAPPKVEGTALVPASRRTAGTAIPKSSADRIPFKPFMGILEWSLCGAGIVILGLLGWWLASAHAPAPLAPRSTPTTLRVRANTPEPLPPSSVREPP